MSDREESPVDTIDPNELNENRFTWITSTLKPGENQSGD